MRKLSDTEIVAIADLCMLETRPPIELVNKGPDLMEFRRPNTQTYFGDKLLVFARAVVEASDDSTP